MKEKNQVPIPGEGGPQMPSIPAMGGKKPKERKVLWTIIILIAFVLGIMYWLDQLGLIDLSNWF